MTRFYIPKELIMSHSVNDVIARMSRQRNTSDSDLALDFVNQFATSGVEISDAIERVASHFTGVSKDKLLQLWESC